MRLAAAAGPGHGGRPGASQLRRRAAPGHPRRRRGARAPGGRARGGAPGRRHPRCAPTTPASRPRLTDAELLGHLVWAGAGYLVTDVWVGGRAVVAAGRCTRDRRRTGPRRGGPARPPTRRALKLSRHVRLRRPGPTARAGRRRGSRSGVVAPRGPCRPGWPRRRRRRPRRRRVAGRLGERVVAPRLPGPPVPPGHRRRARLGVQAARRPGQGPGGAGAGRHGRARPRTAPWCATSTTEGARFLVAEGGQGGRGNARFLSNRRRAPAFAEQGEKGQELWLDMELKLMADVALVGFPNAGKSTLISTVSAAKPKIADYPFTTLEPHLGVVRVGGVRDGTEFVMADIPGLVEGAAEGKGLGHQFLRHIERARVLVVLLDLAAPDAGGMAPAEQLRILLAELGVYRPELLERPRLVVGSKADLASDDEGLCDLVLSAADRRRRAALVDRLAALVQEARAEAAAATRARSSCTGRCPRASTCTGSAPGRGSCSGRAAERAVALLGPQRRRRAGRGGAPAAPPRRRPCPGPGRCARRRRGHGRHHDLHLGRGARDRRGQGGLVLGDRRHRGAALRRDRCGAPGRPHRRRRHVGRHRRRLGRARSRRAAPVGPRRAPSRLGRGPAPADAAVAGRPRPPRRAGRPGAAGTARLRPPHAVPARARDAAPPGRPRRRPGGQRERRRGRRGDPLRRQRPAGRAGGAPGRRASCSSC